MKGESCRTHRFMTAVAAACALVAPAVSSGQYQSPPAPAAKTDSRKAAEAAPAPEFSKEFRKQASKVQKLVNDKKWPEVLAALPAVEALPGLNREELRVLATWRLQATQASGDMDGFTVAIETFLREGFAAPEQIGPMHQQLAAYYNGKKDREKTVHHYRQFIDVTPDADPKDLETLGRLYLQISNYTEAALWFGKAIDVSRSRAEPPDESWFQLRDRCFVELKDQASRLANLEALVAAYPNKEYYSRIVAIYQAETKDDRIVMLNAYRLAVADPQGGLATVGGYLGYADAALVAGSPGEAVRGLERGMKEGIVPIAGTNQVTLQEAKAAVEVDRRNLPAEATAAQKAAKGEVDVKVGLGFYSTGNYEKAAELVRRGITKGGVSRLDDAQLLLGAALLELGRQDEARAAFEAAAAAAGSHPYMAHIANAWLARVNRQGAAPPGG